MAEALREWIHDVIQSVDCFCSTEDIRAGQRWNSEVNTWLADTDFGILCVTPENMSAPWLNFEAGALAKRINDDARVVPITLGFAPSALEEPLKQFNGVAADKPGILRLMKSIADVANTGLNLERTFDRWWDDLEHKLSAIPDSEDQISAPEPPDVAEMFTDIMSSIRGISGDIRHFEPRNRLSTSEFTHIAQALAADDRLREDVSLGNPAAIRFLRDRSRGGKPVTSRTADLQSRREQEGISFERLKNEVRASTDEDEDDLPPTKK